MAMAADRRLTLALLTHAATRPLLEACLDSLERAGAPGRAEVLLGYNGAEDAPREALVSLRRRRWLAVLELPRQSRGAARNAVVAKAGGDVVHFLDDDTVAPAHFLDRLDGVWRRFPDAPAVGGPNLAPPGGGALARCADFLLRSPVGAGPMSARYRRGGAAGPRPGWCFMLSNLGVRREVFTRHGLRFPEDCASAEENLLLHRVERRTGRRPVFDPELFVAHHRRPTAFSFLSQVACNGRGRAQITLAEPRSLQPAVLAPAAGAAAAALLAANGAWAAASALTAVYGLACAAEAVRMAVSERDAAAWRLLWLIPSAHAAYVYGLAAGLVGGRPAPAARALVAAEAEGAS